MRPETTLLFWWLNLLNKKRYDLLLERCGSLDQALAQLSPTLLKGIGLRDDTVQKAFVRLEEFDAAAELARLAAAGVEVVSIEDDAYPRLLKETADPPVFLSYRGDLSVLKHPCVALVGTRDMSPSGERVAAWVTPPLVRGGCTTVSGLAAGIDGVVARSTLEHGGRTVAVLGGGLGYVTPREHLRLAEEIVRKGGLVLSEYPYGDAPGPLTFPARNRIIAGLSLATVVIEAPLQSGALITARFALEENREVFACPGAVFDPGTEGCNRLIAEGQAQLLRAPEDVLRTIGVVTPGVSPAQRSFTPDNDDEAAVYALLTTLPTSMDDLALKSGKSAGDLAAHLTMLELRGAIAKAGNGWVRS